MNYLQETITIDTNSSVELVNITEDVNRIIQENEISEGLVNISTMHTTSAIIINEDETGLKRDIINFVETIVPYDKYEHDKIDNNARSHLKAVMLTPNQTLPVNDKMLSLGTWQSIFFLELDGPRRRRKINITIIY